MIKPGDCIWHGWDRRKMQIEIENKDEKSYITFNPEIDAELKRFSEESLERSSTLMKYTPLKLWASYRYKLEKEVVLKICQI